MSYESRLEQYETQRKAAKLVEFGCQPHIRPGGRNTDSEYQEAINAYLRDSAFRDTVEAIAAGRGFNVLHVDDDGIILGAARPDHASVLKPGDVGQRYQQHAEERMALGIVLLAVTAAFFPDEDALRDDDPLAQPPRLTVQDLHARIKSLADTLATQERGDSDGAGAYVETGRSEAWEIVREKAEMARTANNQVRSGSLYAHVERGLRLLEEQGLVRRRGDEGGGAYSPLRRFRKHAELLAAEEAFRAVQAAQARLTAADGPASADT